VALMRCLHLSLFAARLSMSSTCTHNQRKTSPTKADEVIQLTADQNQNPPANTGNTPTGADAADGVFVGAIDDGPIGPQINIRTEHVHFQPNNVAEIGLLADRHPELAAQIVTNDAAKSERENGSFRLGMIITGTVAISAIGFSAWALISMGVWQALALVATLLGISHVLRTILKGEWSDTSWFGKMLGAKPPKDP